MPIVTAGDLAEWAASLDPDMPIILADEFEYEDESSTIEIEKASAVAIQVYLYRFSDAPDLGYVSDQPTTTAENLITGEDVDWAGTPCWRLGH